jgi:hypothetical protein
MDFWATNARAYPRARLWRAAALSVGAVLACVAVLAVAVAPASAAGTDCNPKLANPDWLVCVVVAGGKASGYVRWYYGDDPYFDPATVYVRQCRTDMSGCVVIAANRAGGANIVSTSAKPAALGHVYQACTSFDVVVNGVRFDSFAVNRCSAWRSWP